MDKLFLTILNMNIPASYVILVVILLRFLFKKAPKMFSYALWAIVLFRLIFPFSFQSIVSLLPFSTERIPRNIIHTAIPKISSGVNAVDQFVNNALPAAAQRKGVNPIQILLYAAEIIWIFGILLLLTYSIISMLRLKKQLSSAINTSENLYLARNLKTPFVLGIFKPAIYLPAGLDKEETAYILRHEQTHIRRRDHIVKLIAFLVLCLHWFNPLVWTAFILMTKDMEMACDEAVLHEMGNSIKKDYSSSLLSLAAGHQIIGSTPLAFGEGEVKGRVKNVLNYKKPSFWVIIASIAALTCIAIGLLSNPKHNVTPDNDHPAWLKQAYEWRTKYVGNASAVGNITDLLSNSSNLEKDGFKLLTATEPYEVLVHYISDLDAKEAYKIRSGVLEQNAVILFSLIENLGTITIDINDETVANFGRSEAETVFGSLWEQTETYNDFCILYDSIAANGQNIFSPISETVLQPMIQFQDTRYLLSPAKMDLDPAKLKQVGQIKTTVPSSEIPSENNEANTEIADAPIYDSGDSIIVLINDDYCLYKPEYINFTITKHTADGSQSSCSIKSAEEGEQFKSVIMDSLLRSAAWPALDLNTFDEYYVLSGWSGASKYYAFRYDGNACLQSSGSMYTNISNESYAILNSFFEK